jgi:hypothetical protein
VSGQLRTHHASTNVCLHVFQQNVIDHIADRHGSLRDCRDHRVESAVGCDQKRVRDGERLGSVNSKLVSNPKVGQPLR